MKKIIVAALLFIALVAGAEMYIALRHSHDHKSSQASGAQQSPMQTPSGGADLSSFAAVGAAPTSPSTNMPKSPITTMQPAESGQSLYQSSGVVTNGRVQDSPQKATNTAPPSSPASPPTTGGETPGSACRPRPSYACPLGNNTKN